MKNRILLVACLVLLCSHDMYLKMDTYFIAPNQESTLQLYNGTFDKSENTIDRNRMLDASMIGNGERIALQEDQWREKDSITWLTFTSENSGTWVAGVSTAPRDIALSAEDFNNYLAHDGVKDMLDQREKEGSLDQDAVEKYSKHVKAIFQVGDERTDDWNTALGYPIEFIPLSNPYEIHSGESLTVKLLSKGAPLANQLVYADYVPAADSHSHSYSHDADSTHMHASEEGHGHDSQEHSHEEEDAHSHEHGTAEVEKSKSSSTETHIHDGTTHSHDDDTSAAEETESHEHTSGQQLRTDSNGELTVDLNADGIWYLRTIHLVTTEEEGLTHESNWATLTFEVTHDHGEDQAHDHDDAHEHDEEDQTFLYVFGIGSLILLGALFFWFNRKR